MSASIFQPEITTLESQVAALQAQIASAQERISKLAEAESIADGALQALQGAVDKVTTLAPGAIANLKTAVLNLFQGGDNPSNDGNGNNPNPEPQPSDDGGCEMTPIGAESVEAIAIQPELLNGQSCEWSSPWATPFASPLATPLCCPLEDAPQSVLVGQAVELAQIAFSRDGFKYIDDDAIAVETSTTLDTPKEPAYFELIPVSDAVAYGCGQNQLVEG